MFNLETTVPLFGLASYVLIGAIIAGFIYRNMVKTTWEITWEDRLILILAVPLLPIILVFSLIYIGLRIIIDRCRKWRSRQP